jgi:hypothetical protein
MRLRLMIVPVLLALAISASAASKTITLYSKANVGGTALEPGEYKVTIDESGSVTFAKGKNVVAKAQGKIVNAEKASRDTVITRSGRLASLQLGGSKQEVVFDDASGSMVGSN